MKRTDIRTAALVIGALIAGWLMGASGIASSQAEEVTPAPVVQGEIIKVCINLKSGAIRAASKCDSKTERKTVIGGVGARGAVGPQGEKGDTGAQGIQGIKGDAGSQGIQGTQGVQGEKGIQGLQGLMGQTGAAGTVSGLRKQTIYYYDGEYGSWCYGGLLAKSAIGAVTTSGSKFTVSVCSREVYVP